MPFNPRFSFLITIVIIASEAINRCHRFSSGVRKGPAQRHAPISIPCQSHTRFSVLQSPPRKPSILRAGRSSGSDDQTQKGPVEIARKALVKAADKNYLLFGIAAAISLARLSPEFGMTGGFIELNRANKLGVALVFFIQGLSLKLGQLKGAAMNVKFNSFVQAYSLMVLPSAALGLSYMLKTFTTFPAPLTTGITALGCLPTTINMCVVLTDAAGGDRALALFNAVLGNILGLFVTPGLLFLILGKSLTLPYGAVLQKLAKTVLLPFALGQGLQKAAPAVLKFRERNRKMFSRVSETALIFIVLNTFSDAFKQGLGVHRSDILILLAIIPSFYAASVAGALILFRKTLGYMPARQTVAAVLVSTQKTLAFGLPLIRTVFEGHPNLGGISAPLLVYHPMQLVAGALMNSKMKAYVEADDANREERSKREGLDDSAK